MERNHKAQKSLARLSVCLKLKIDHYFFTGQLPSAIVNKPLRSDRPQLVNTKILLIDELDYVLTKDQSVLYNLFEWPQRKKANLVVIGVANTLDLPEKFMARISSRIGNTRLVFTPYSSNEIREIINQRISGGADVFDTSAVNFISKKVALISSDIRKTLMICRQAVERCRDECLKSTSSGSQFEEKNKVTVELVSKMFDSAYSSSPLTEFVASSPTLTKVFLTEIYSEIKMTPDAKCALFTKVYMRFKNGTRGGMSLFSPQEMMCLAKKLRDRKIITLRNNPKTDAIEISVIPNLDDLAYALKDDPYFAKRIIAD